MHKSEFNHLIFGLLGFIPMVMFIILATEVQGIFDLISVGSMTGENKINLVDALTSLSTHSVLFGLVAFMGTFLVGVILDRKQTHSKGALND